MSKRVDPETLLCRAHGVQGCSACMVDDFYDWLNEQKEKRAKQRQVPVDERFDGGDQ